jgi:hypothetical protein
MSAPDATTINLRHTAISRCLLTSPAFDPGDFRMTPAFAMTLLDQYPDVLVDRRECVEGGETY